MKCKVKAFGITREIIRTRELEIMLPAGATVAELKNHLLRVIRHSHRLLRCILLLMPSMRPMTACLPMGTK